MEFSFEYYDFLRALNENTGVVYSIAFYGVLLLYLPIRLVIKIMKLPANGKTNILVSLTIFAVWLLGSIALGILSFNDPSGIKIFLVWICIAIVTILYAVTNGTRLFKIYTGWISKIKKDS